MPISGHVSFILLDQNLAEDLRDLLPGRDVRHAIEMGWDRPENGALLTAAEAAGFEVMMTADKRIRYQQNLVGRRIPWSCCRPITGGRYEPMRSPSCRPSV